MTPGRMSKNRSCGQKVKKKKEEKKEEGGGWGHGVKAGVGV